MADEADAVVAERHRHHVEAAARGTEPSPLQVMLGEADEAALLPPRHGGRGRVTPRGASALDLHEDPRVAVVTDEIDLAVLEPGVALDHAQAGALEKPGGGVFCGAAERLAGIRHARILSRPAAGENVQSFRQRSVDLAPSASGGGAAQPPR